MALSRFWGILFITSIVFLLGSFFFTGKPYSLDGMISGAKGDKVLISERAVAQVPPQEMAQIQAQMAAAAKEKAPKGRSYVVEGGILRTYDGTQAADGLLPTAKNTITDLVLPLVAYLAFFSGLLQLLIDSGASEKLAKFISPVFRNIFPSVPEGHPALSYITLNFTANFLGLDSAATPFGLKAMNSLQELNPSKEVASDAQIMFMCLHAAGLTLLPTSIIGYRAAAGAANPADIMIPCIITSFVGTLAALILVGIRQKINFFSAVLLLSVAIISAGILGLMLYITGLSPLSRNYFTANLSGVVLLGIILLIIVLAFYKEKNFLAKQTNIFDSFVVGAKEGAQVALSIFPYILGILMAISIFRNSGLFEMISGWLSRGFMLLGMSRGVTDALPVALLRPFSSSGARGFLIDSLNTYGADSLTGRLASIFQSSAETTFYVIAVYFGAIKIRNTRYTLSTMLWVDLICVITAVVVATLFFG